MAWLDDRAWCHSKLVNLPDKAFRVYINSISYSSGMGLKGVLTPPQQKLMGATSQIRQKLIEAGLWDDLDGSIEIHDWADHNSKRDERREKDRVRKREARRAERPQDSPQDAPVVSPHAEGSEGSEGRDEDQKRASDLGGSSTSTVDAPLANDLKEALAVARLIEAVGDVDEEGLAKIRGFARRLPEGSIHKVAESVTYQRPRNPVGYAIAALGSELRERA